MSEQQLTTVVVAVLLLFVFLCLLGFKRSRKEYTGEARPDALPMGPGEIERYIRANITMIGRNSFPDNPDEEWSVLQVKHETEFILAEVKPSSNEVGYERFVFCFPDRTIGAPGKIATYSFENDSYELLSTSSGVKKGSLPVQVVF